MKAQLERRPQIARVIVASAVLAIALPSLANKYSIDRAVPAEATHADGAVDAAPDLETEDPAANNFVSVQNMLRGYCRAGSQFHDSGALGGFGDSENVARKIRVDSQGKGLFLLAQPGVVTSFANGPGMRVVLVNQTKEILTFPAADSRVAIVQEAQDTDGTWKPIEYLPSSWCGNSYHRVFLSPKHFWAFAALRYQGTMPTKLRFSMALADGSSMHSNAFDGSVNPDQFTTKERTP